TGYVPIQPAVYRLAFRHSSLVRHPANSANECNERLEYLGDSVLDTIVADYLFKKYPLKNEGFLTEMRSKIVSRQSLNEIGAKLGFEGLVEYNRRSSGLNRSMYGNSLEALIGALYMDRGYTAARSFVIKRIVNVHLSMDELVDRNDNYKSQLMEYAQKNRLLPVAFHLIEEAGKGRQKLFTVQCTLGGNKLGTGTHEKKKLAEQEAAKASLEMLEVGV
ncbi:MAG: ribonuclease III, partial [Sphingobacteriia bacterium]